MSWRPQVPKPIWIILIIGTILYFPTLFNGFVWDDEEQILNNPQILSLANIPQFFLGSTFNSGGSANGLTGLYYKPLMTTAFALLGSTVGPVPFYYHALQMALHLANTVLIYLILKYLFEKFKLDTRLSLAAALLFLVHPINAEAVVYVSDYQEVLFFLFAALAFWLILRGKNVFYSSLLILPSLLSKETGAVFAMIIFVYLFLFDRKKVRDYVQGIAVVLGVYAFLRFALAGIGFNKHGLTPISTMNFTERMVNVPQIIFTYLRNFFWPANLAINQQWVVRSIDPFILIIDLSFLGLLSILSFLIFKKARSILPLWFFFLIWFLLGLGFHLQFFPLDLTISDRWFYLPIVGLLGMLAVFGSLRKWGMWGVWGLWIVVLVLAGRTWVREFDWRDGLTLYSHDINLSPNAFDLENNLGVELFRAGRIEEAKPHFEKSVELSPKWWTNWNNLGAVYEQEGNLDLAAQDYRKSIDNGQYYLAYQNYAGILIKEKKYTEAKEFLEKEALPRLPNNARLQELWLAVYNMK
ncbi:hypothetical protein M1403_03875 [Patescibacteria group bacterium]|nr:hypothetical protein [Patescibacteria group bacterium]